MKKFEIVLSFCVSALLFSSLFFSEFSLEPVSAGDCGNYADMSGMAADAAAAAASVGDAGSGMDGGFFGNGGGTSCSCSCNTCNPPACPPGTDATDRGDICLESTARNDCGFTCNPAGCGTATGCFSAWRSCWWFENAPPPGAPTGIGVKIRNITCDLGNNIRIPYPTFGSTDGFLAYGSENNRLSDLIRGTVPLLNYRYRLPQLDLTSSWLGTSTRYAPSMSVNECEIYTIYAGARSQNRCQGWTNGPEISRTFEINYIPRVRNIEVEEDPNNRVSGNPTLDASNHDFACTIDNPKIFTVMFKDDDGCGDLWESFPSDTNICGGVKTSGLYLRAVDVDTNQVFAPKNSTGYVTPIPGSVTCVGENLVMAQFELAFEGNVNAKLEIQAKADDIVGDTSGWRSLERQSDDSFAPMIWYYDGLGPELNIDADIVVGVDELNVEWMSKDDILSLSGVRGVRISARLTQGEILTGEGDYGSITYEGETYNLQDSFGEWVTVWNPGLVSVSEAALRKEVSETHLADIGINQDGYIAFRLEAADRACNYAPQTDNSVSEVELGTPWVATRGGFVHSGDDIQLAVKQSIYGDVLADAPDPNEITSLSTELLTVGGSNVLGFGFRDYVYDLLNYTKRLSHSWYDLLYRRAESRDPEGTMWSVATVDANSEISEGDLAKCITEQHIYFVPGSLVVDPSVYENLSPENTLAGCVFIVKENVTIGAGEHKSVGVNPDADGFRPEYDLVKGYFIVDGQINIEFVDKEEAVRDGLKVVGGLFATGGDSRSIILGRSFQLRQNLQFPVLITFHDSRYLDVGRKVLGDSFGGSYVRDIGLKE